MAYDLGLMYADGEGVAEDNREAVKWVSFGCGAGVYKRQYNLGLMYFSGKGVAKDNRKAIKWYRFAAGGGCMQYFLGDVWSGTEL